MARMITLFSMRIRSFDPSWTALEPALIYEVSNSTQLETFDWKRRRSTYRHLSNLRPARGRRDDHGLIARSSVAPRLLFAAADDRSIAISGLRDSILEISMCTLQCNSGTLFMSCVDMYASMEDYERKDCFWENFHIAENFVRNEYGNTLFACVEWIKVGEVLLNVEFAELFMFLMLKEMKNEL